jgi:hypothetical protein
MTRPRTNTGYEPGYDDSAAFAEQLAAEAEFHDAVREYVNAQVLPSIDTVLQEQLAPFREHMAQIEVEHIDAAVAPTASGAATTANKGCVPITVARPPTSTTVRPEPRGNGALIR